MPLSELALYAVYNLPNPGVPSWPNCGWKATLTRPDSFGNMESSKPTSWSRMSRKVVGVLPRSSVKYTSPRRSFRASRREPSPTGVRYWMRA